MAKTFVLYHEPKSIACSELPIGIELSVSPEDACLGDFKRYLSTAHTFKGQIKYYFKKIDKRGEYRVELKNDSDLLPLEKAKGSTEEREYFVTAWLEETESSSLSESNGLPHDEKLETKNINKCLKMIKKFKNWRYVLVKSTPSESRKSCLYQLLQNAELEKIAKKEINFEYKISAISFAGFNGRTYNELEEYFKEETGRSIDDFFFEKTVYQHIVLMDETQNIFKISHFWTMFKDVDQPVESEILAFAVYDSKIPFGFSSAISQFQVHLKHSDIELDEDDFNE